MASIPIIDLALAKDPEKKPQLLTHLRTALFDVGFLYIVNHDIEATTISHLVDLLPALFALPDSDKQALSKLKSPHFLGYSGYAEETTLGKKDLREQFDFATELPVVYRETAAAETNHGHDLRPSIGTEKRDSAYDRDFTQLFWRLRGPNQWPSETTLPGFRAALTAYHDAVEALSYRFVHLVEEAFGIPVGTFDHFFSGDGNEMSPSTPTTTNTAGIARSFLPPQHRIKLIRYPPPSLSNAESDTDTHRQGVGAHKDSSGWLTFLLQVGDEPGLEVLPPAAGPSNQGSVKSEPTWLPVPPIPGSFVVNVGNAFDAATAGAVRATIHRVALASPDPHRPPRPRYSIPFFQGLPLDVTASEARAVMPETVKGMRRDRGDDGISAFLDPRWDSLGESQLRKWIRSHRDVGLKWYGPKVVEYYTAGD